MHVSIKLLFVSPPPVCTTCDVGVCIIEYAYRIYTYSFDTLCSVYCIIRHITIKSGIMIWFTICERSLSSLMFLRSVFAFLSALLWFTSACACAMARSAAVAPAGCNAFTLPCSSDMLPLVHALLNWLYYLSVVVSKSTATVRFVAYLIGFISCELHQYVFISRLTGVLLRRFIDESFTAPFSFSIFWTPSLSRSSILPDTSSTSTISSGTVCLSHYFAVEDNADNPTRKSDSLPFSIVADSFADSPTLLDNVTFPFDTDLSVQMRPTFFVLLSSVSCHLLMVTLSATVFLLLPLAMGKSPHTRNPAMTMAERRCGNSFVSFCFQSFFHVTHSFFDDSKNKISKVINHKKNSRPFVRVFLSRFNPPPNPFWCERKNTA